jgi:hypothetical protein
MPTTTDYTAIVEKNKFVPFARADLRPAGTHSTLMLSDYLRYWYAKV